MTFSDEQFNTICELIDAKIAGLLERKDLNRHDPIYVESEKREQEVIARIYRLSTYD